MPIRLTVCLLVSAALFAGRLSAQTAPEEAPAALANFQIVTDLETAPPLHPLENVEQNDPRLQRPATRPFDDAFNHRYGFDSRDDRGYDPQPGENPDAVSRQHWPYPLLRVVMIHPPKPGGNYLAGDLYAATGTRIWRRPKREAGDAEAWKEIVEWRWDVPKAMQESHFIMSQDIYHEKFGALGLIPTGHIENAMLYSFDMTTGLRWQAKIPALEAVQEYIKRKKIKMDEETQRASYIYGPFVIIGTVDGSRTLVTVSVGNGTTFTGSTLLFVYDAEGVLLRTRFFPDHSPGTIMASSLQEGFGRAPTTDRFVLGFRAMLSDEDMARYHIKKKVRVIGSFLMDAEGSIQGRFLDEEGQPACIEEISDTHALIVKRIPDKSNPDGSTKRILYKLPPVAPPPPCARWPAKRTLRQNSVS